MRDSSNSSDLQNETVVSPPAGDSSSDFDNAPASFEGLDSLLLRLASDGNIYYVNTAFCRYVGLTREELIGQASDVLKKCLGTDIYSAFERPSEGSVSSAVVRDALRGKVLEVHCTFRAGFVDVVLQDVTHAHALKAYVNKYVSTDLENLSEEELRTFKFPERRFMTVSFTDLRGFTAMSEMMTPEDVRVTINAYLEEVMQAVENNHGTVDKIVGDEMMALFGAPRYYADHALRAIKTACDQMRNMRMLREQFGRSGKEMPECGIGINTGDMVLGNIGSSSRQNYTVIGAPVNLAARLCGAARGSEILLTETTLQQALQGLPAGWESYTYQTQDVILDLGDIGGKTEEIMPLPEELRGKVILIGPSAASQPDQSQYSFTFLYLAKIKGVAEPMPVIAAAKLQEGESATLLDDTRLTTPQSEKIFGKYRLIEIIGRGGMGEVWRGRDTFGNVVAIKMLLAGEGASESQVARFQREAEVMAQLPHRNICRIHEIGVLDGVHFIAMEYVEGASLAEILNFARRKTDHASDKMDLKSIMNSIDSEKASHHSDGLTPVDSLPIDKSRAYSILPLQQTLAIITKICDGIQYVHEHGVLHRDLKPGNIIIRQDGDPVVMDFGLAKLDIVQRETSLSVTGEIFGTIEYMAPEQAQSSKDVDERADVYSIGAILYQLITGQKHFSSSGNILADAQTLQNWEPAPPKQVWKGIDTDLEIITLKALRPDKEARYRNVQMLRDDLLRYQRGEIISAKAATIGEIARKWILRNKVLASVIGVALAIIIVSTLGFIISLQHQIVEAKKARHQAEANAREARENEARAVAAKEEARKSEKRAMDALAMLDRKKAETIQLEVEKNKQIKARDEAEKELKLAEAQRKQTEEALAPTLIPNARQAFHRSNLREALDALENVIAINPNLSEAWLLKARIYMARFQLKEALASLDQARKIQGFVSDAEFNFLWENASQFYDVTKAMPNPMSDRELQLALAKILMNGSRNLDDQAAGTYLQKNPAGK